MKKNIIDPITLFISGAGITASTVNISELLNIILLILSILNILVLSFFKIKDAITNKNKSDAEKLNDITKELEDTINKIEDKKHEIDRNNE